MRNHSASSEKDFLNRSENLLRFNKSDMSASCCLAIYPNVNFNHGVEHETDVKINKKISSHDGAVHRVDGGGGHRGLRF